MKRKFVIQEDALYTLIYSAYNRGNSEAGKITPRFDDGHGYAEIVIQKLKARLKEKRVKVGKKEGDGT